MKITADSMVCEIKHGESLLDAVKKLDLDMMSLASRPLAAQIGGEVFSLRYTPFKDVDIHLLNYKEEAGRRVYERTLQFIFIAAVRRLFPAARVCVRYTLGPGLYITIDKEPALGEQDVLKLEAEMRNIVRAAIPLERKRLDIKDAIDFYERDGQTDKAALLKWRKFSYFDVYTIGGYMDYFYGEMAPSTDYADVFRLKFVEGAVILLMPRSDEPDVPSDYEPLPAIASALLFNVGASSGGTDVIALIVEKYTHIHNVAVALFLTDLFMVIAACFVFDLYTALYSFVGLTAKCAFCSLTPSSASRSL